MRRKTEACMQSQVQKRQLTTVHDVVQQLQCWNLWSSAANLFFLRCELWILYLLLTLNGEAAILGGCVINSLLTSSVELAQTI